MIMGRGCVESALEEERRVRVVVVGAGRGSRSLGRRRGSSVTAYVAVPGPRDMGAVAW